jgi:hypothetical protein
MGDKKTDATRSDAPPTAETMSVRHYADAKKLERWQIAALLPHIRARAVELQLAAVHDEMGRILPVEELDALIGRALTGRV